jgi:putative membrane protein
MRGPILKPDDHARIAAAIRAAEARTSGEIVCVLARSSDGYFHAAALVVAIGMLAASMVAVLLLDAWWIAIRPWQLVAIQALALATALAVLAAFPGLRIHLVPRALRYRRAHRNAVSQFLATNIHTTEARTGVLIFLSLAERYAEVVADAGIDARVPQERWNEMVAGLVSHAAAGRLAEGFEGAIAAAGALLTADFPPREDDANELDDRLVEI